jgi:Cellulase (glycosyl hydrolase family 5)
MQVSGWLRAVVVVALTVAAAVVPGRARAAATCGHVVGPFHQAKAQIWQADGRRFVPRGITVSGLEHPDWADFVARDHDQIRAAASAWCANVVRLQVGQWNLNNSPGFVRAMQAEVSYAESLGLAVVINDQAEWDPASEPMPTEASKTFWRTVAPMYAHDPLVIFDVFNEPSLGSWACWHDGGTACPRPGFTGMQALAALIRRHAPNLIWVDGPSVATTLAAAPGATRTVRLGAATLAGVESWPITGVAPRAYSIHHPGGPHTQANWTAKFGYLAAQRIAPVVVGETTQWAAARAECWTDGPWRYPAYLGYLAGLHIGVTAWSLDPGVLVGSSPAQPTGFGVWSQWRCVNAADPAANHSAGKRIQAWYEQLSGL